MKRYKKEENGLWEVGQVLYTKHFALTLDRGLCKGCELCMLACPREAIALTPAADIDGKAAAPLVDIDENKCDFHGICAVVCPFGAIDVVINGENERPAVSRDAFPELIRDIRVNEDRCPPGCRRCEQVCPLGIITVKSDEGKTFVDIQKELCAGCRICWLECPETAIEATKFIEGSIQVHPEACPENCRRCMDICPVDALALNENGEIYAKDIPCVYCGACLQVCPSRGEALQIERTAMRHTPINSGAWNKGLERMTSSAGLTRELTAERAKRAREVIKNLGLDEVNE